MRDVIVSDLKQIEAEHGVRVLFACESGSRAWGFESPDSDYDVRFIYVRPRDEYLSIHLGRDVIEAMLPNDVDLAGWDLRKTLALMQKSNPALAEWLLSPIVYQSVPEFVADLSELGQAYFDLDRLYKHYLSMAFTNWKAYLLGDEVRLKKYLYVLRPVFAARWIKEHGQIPPIEFSALRAGVSVPTSVDEAIESLLAAKRVTSEVGATAPVPALQSFLEAELPRLESLAVEPGALVESGPLDACFRRWAV